MANWSRQELLLALNLYLETPFGKQHKAYPPIVELARNIGRTPSAVAMKLNNLTSLDPSEKARGIRGLTGASKLDRMVWAEFENNREKTEKAPGALELSPRLDKPVDAMGSPRSQEEQGLSHAR